MYVCMYVCATVCTVITYIIMLIKNKFKNIFVHIRTYTMKSLNDGHLEEIEIVLCREVSFIQKLNNTLKY